MIGKNCYNWWGKVSAEEKLLLQKPFSLSIYLFRQYIKVFIRLLIFKSIASVHVSASVNLMSKVQPFLRTSSNVVWLPGSLHHRHSLPLAHIAMGFTATPRRPLPYNICKRKTLTHSGTHQDMLLLVHVFTWRRGHGDTQPAFPGATGIPLCPVLKVYLCFVAPPSNKQDIEQKVNCSDRISSSTRECLINSRTDTPDLLSSLPNGHPDPPVGWAKWELRKYNKEQRWRRT